MSQQNQELTQNVLLTTPTGKWLANWESDPFGIEIQRFEAAFRQTDTFLRLVEQGFEKSALLRVESGTRYHIIDTQCAWEGWQASKCQIYGTFQDRVQPWMQVCFGEEISNDAIERNHRFLEESLELVQACGCTASEAHQLVDYVFGRNVGEKQQEIGGVMVTLAALCLAQKLDMHAAGEVELARIWTKVEQIRAKQAAKPKHSPLPELSSIIPPCIDDFNDLDEYFAAERKFGAFLGQLQKSQAPKTAVSWVKCAERLPTPDDADEMGFLYAFSNKTYFNQDTQYPLSHILSWAKIVPDLQWHSKPKRPTPPIPEVTL